MSALAVPLIPWEEKRHHQQERLGWEGGGIVELTQWKITSHFCKKSIIKISKFKVQSYNIQGISAGETKMGHWGYLSQKHTIISDTLVTGMGWGGGEIVEVTRWRITSHKCLLFKEHINIKRVWLFNWSQDELRARKDTILLLFTSTEFSRNISTSREKNLS